MEALTPSAKERLQYLQDLSGGQLTYLYRNASLLLCTSAHEGYCMPLVEAATCGLAVAAMPQPAVLETLNGGGILLDEDPSVAAFQIRNFLLNATDEEHELAIPVMKPLPTEELLRLILGDL